MDVLVKNTEMPNSCIDPKTSHGCFRLLHCKIGRQRVNDGKSLSGRPSDCPLIPVPEHDDLVSRKAILSYFETAYQMGADMDYEDAVAIVSNEKAIPTVLEANNG